jgi:sugar phosphate isomerase/epimerase
VRLRPTDNLIPFLPLGCHTRWLAPSGNSVDSDAVLYPITRRMSDFDSPCTAVTRTPSTRREVLAIGIGLAAGATALTPLSGMGQARGEAHRRMKICLTPGSVGVTASQTEAIQLAQRYRFDAVEPYGGYLASLTGAQVEDLLLDLKKAGLVWGAAGLAVEFRGDAEKFTSGMKELPKIAAALKRVGADRVGTWLMPGHNDLTYLKNLRQHTERLGGVARVLADHGLRLGLEYVGTATLRSRFKFPFVHTLAETLELIAEIGAANIGLVLDTWHWWQAGDAADNISALKNEQVISVDLNDAPAGVPKDRQQDGRRELPGATGVIDIAAFLSALANIGYDGPVRAEPFNAAVNALDNDAACQAVIAAMQGSLQKLE